MQKTRVQKEYREWLGVDDISLLTFDSDENGKVNRIGGGNRGHVYLGRCRFKDGSLHKVAIKRFLKKDFSDEDAAKYTQVINDLHDADIPIPKTAMVKLKAGHKFGDETLTKDEWVQVQKAILYQNKSTMVYRLSNPKYPDSVRKEAITHMAKVANLGYLPALDLAGPAEFPSTAVHSIPFDFDQLVERGKIPANDRAKELDTGIMWLSELNQSNEKELFEVAEKVLNDEMRNALKKVRGTIIN